MADWTAFFSAELGAAAALAGLVMVSISINLPKILEDPSLPGRAAETLALPTGVVVVASYVLVPGQSAVALGSEIAGAGALMWLLPTYLQLRLRHAQGRGAHWRNFVPRVLLTQVSALPVIAAGGMLMTGTPGAFYWMVPGIVTALISTVINAWVLLVEILR